MHAAGVVGTGLESMAAQATSPVGNDDVPALASTAALVLPQAAAGPESRHCSEPAGRLRFVVAAAGC